MQWRDFYDWIGDKDPTPASPMENLHIDIDDNQTRLMETLIPILQHLCDDNQQPANAGRARPNGNTHTGSTCDNMLCLSYSQCYGI